MADGPFLHRRQTNRWQNWHETYAVDAGRRYELHWGDGGFTAAKFRQSGDLVLDLIGQARSEGVVLRPLGGTWSFSQVSGQQDAWLLDTTQANRKARLTGSALHPDFAGDADSLLLVQCGVSIFEINRYLEKTLGRSLATTGASNGQTFVGAMSTSTHGSALAHGAIQNQVVAIQLLSVHGQNLWIERPGRPVVSDALAGQFGAQVRRDDNLFAAALVSLGLLGVVHAVVIETRPIFLLSVSQFPHPFDDGLRHAMRTLDTSRLTIPASVTIPPGGAAPYFFQVVVNPHRAGNPAHVKVMYELPFPAGRPIDYRLQGKYGAAYDLPGVVAKLLDAIDPLTPALTNKIVEMQLKPFENEVGTWGETFDWTTPRAQSAGTALAVPADRTVEAVELAIAAHRDFGPAPIVFACRFVQKSSGMLAFQRFDPTCVIDIDGLNSNNTQLIMERVRMAFDAVGMPYAQHWGKFHDLTGGRLERSYGADLQAFRQVRASILPSVADRKVFSISAQESVIGL
jgi:hypothetical protein